MKGQRNRGRPKRYWEKDVEDWMGQVSGEWDEQQKIGWCTEDPSRQQRPETDKWRGIIPVFVIRCHLGQCECRLCQMFRFPPFRKAQCMHWRVVKMSVGPNHARSYEQRDSLRELVMLLNARYTIITMQINVLRLLSRRMLPLLIEYGLIIVYCTNSRYWIQWIIITYGYQQNVWPPHR